MSLTRFVLRGFRRPREVVDSALGKLERQVMDELWRRGRETSVREMHAAFGGALAYTTVMTTLDRLHKKGVLERRKEGRAFLYAPGVSRSQFAHQMASDVIDGLLGQGVTAEPVLSSIVDAVSDRDRALLDDLERLVKEKRRALRGRSAP